MGLSQAELGMPEGGLVGSASVSCNAAQTCNICCFGVVVLLASCMGGFEQVLKICCFLQTKSLGQNRLQECNRI